ncbi:hypothetical protein RHMOL_Rhmol05G0220900 [Rhododendron molle]|uniref:Uncharacterized protein n=1 Tax=Rhododendron molle TaxID=49168 RepID=A0ACC0NSZ3_RHOML|nr:hypothetical protein RHMOL_Rhmol05G0220900 [Rhododendron molle]
MDPPMPETSKTGSKSDSSSELLPSKQQHPPSIAPASDSGQVVEAAIVVVVLYGFCED